MFTCLITIENAQLLDIFPNLRIPKRKHRYPYCFLRSLADMQKNKHEHVALKDVLISHYVTLRQNNIFHLNVFSDKRRGSISKNLEKNRIQHKRINFFLFINEALTLLFRLMSSCDLILLSYGRFNLQPSSGVCCMILKVMNTIRSRGQKRSIQ